MAQGHESAEFWRHHAVPLEGVERVENPRDGLLQPLGIHQLGPIPAGMILGERNAAQGWERDRISDGLPAGFVVPDHLPEVFGPPVVTAVSQRVREGPVDETDAREAPLQRERTGRAQGFQEDAPSQPPDRTLVQP